MGKRGNMEKNYGRKDYADFAHVSETIPADEPVFLLRAQDVNAARTIRYWADQHEKSGGDPKLCDLAREHAKRMDDWPIKKVADMAMFVADEK